MSKKREKKILKLLRAQRTPKRVAGVKIPKMLRRWSDSQLGSVIIAQLALSAGGNAMASPATAKLRRKAEKVTQEVVASLTNAADGGTSGLGERREGRSRRKAEDRAH